MALTVGDVEGDSVGNELWDGWLEGFLLGMLDSEGFIDGCDVGNCDGWPDGNDDGRPEILGESLGCDVGQAEPEGFSEG